jgi:hypothetical protein
MPDDIVFKLKAELRKMTKGDLLRMVLSQKERKCVLGGVCPFLLEYRHILFCVSEILGHISPGNISCHYPHLPKGFDLKDISIP